MTEHDEIGQLENSNSDNARKFRGQFMDMKHVSSDMLTSEKPNHASEIVIEPKSQPEDDDVENTEVDDAEIGDSSEDEILNVFTHDVDEITQPQLDATGENDEEGHKSPDAEFVEEDDEEEDLSQSDPLQSPFLTNVDVEKRPLGTPLSKSLDDKEDSGDEIDDLDELLDFDLHQKQLPADDGGKGTLVPALSAGDESYDKKDPEPDRLPRANAQGKPDKDQAQNTSAAIDSSMIFQSQRKDSDMDDVLTSDSPFANSAITPKPITRPAAKKKKSSVINWVLMIILLLIAGGATGALVYLYFPELLSWLNF